MEFAVRYPDCQAALKTWLKVTRAARWTNLTEVRLAYPSTDMVKHLAIFNIKGNHYRLIVRMEFAAQRVYVKEFLSHADYDRERWKKWL